MAMSGDNLVVGTAGRHVWIWDVRQMGSVKQRRESSLKFQTRYIAGMPSGEGWCWEEAGSACINARVTLLHATQRLRRRLH